MADFRSVRRNEQRRAFANQLYNLGAALVAAAAIRLVAERAFSWFVVLWIVGAFILILAGHGLLGLLEDDADDL